MKKRSAASHTRQNMKIACQRHKNQNFEKNGTYIKDSVALSVPTNFFDNPTKFGDRISQKPKKAIFAAGRPAVNMPAAFCSFWPLIFSQMDSYAGMLKIKGQFKVTCKKIGQNRIIGKNLGGEANLPPPPA